MFPPPPTRMTNSHGLLNYITFYLVYDLICNVYNVWNPIQSIQFLYVLQIVNWHPPNGGQDASSRCARRLGRPDRDVKCVLIRLHRQDASVQWRYALMGFYPLVPICCALRPCLPAVYFHPLGVWGWEGIWWIPPLHPIPSFP
jgi:hypothetical protein